MAEIYFSERLQGNVFAELMAPVSAKKKIYIYIYNNFLSVKMPFIKVGTHTGTDTRREERDSFWIQASLVGL